MSSHRDRTARLLIGAIVSTQLMTIGTANAQTAAAAACASNPYCVGTIVVGGVLYLVLSNGSRVPYQGTGGYLENPEGSSDEWTDYVWGGDFSEGRARCQQIAQTHGVVLENVVQVGRNRYECRFRTYRT